MPRRVLSESKKALTPLAEDFLAQPVLKTALEELGELVKVHLPNDCDYSPFHAVRQAAGYLAALGNEAWLEQQRAEIRELEAKLAKKGK